MASYTYLQLSGTGSAGEDLSGLKTFTFTNPSASSYFFMATNPNSVGFFDSGSLTNFSGSYVASQSMGLVTSPYVMGVVVQPGVSSFTFTPNLATVSGSNYRMSGTGMYSLVVSGGSLPPFVNPTLTTGSAVSIVSQSPFGSGNSYSFVSSANSYITTPGSNDWAVGTGDFTIEWFQYQTTTAGFQRAFTVDDFNSIDIGVSVEDTTFYYWNNSAVRYTSFSATTANVWIHWAVVRQSGVTKVYKNGTQLGSQITDNNNINNITDPLTIGNENTSTTIAAFVGYITNFRWVKGLAVYTGNFTVPTSPLTATATANPYGGSNTQAIGSGFTKLLLIP
jgi:hypothetical protein